MAKVDYFARKLDDKNRLTLPSEVRDEFAEGIVITRGFGTYLHAYPKEVWQQDVESRLKGDILDERIADLNVRFRMGKKDVVYSSTRNCAPTLFVGRPCYYGD
jgi:DNA-binding transcriptional regulator/RsmH inhibitor MraZ